MNSSPNQFCERVYNFRPWLDEWIEPHYSGWHGLNAVLKIAIKFDTIFCQSVHLPRGGLKIPNLTFCQSCNFEPSLGNRSSGTRSLVIMINYVLIVLLKNSNLQNLSHLYSSI